MESNQVLEQFEVLWQATKKLQSIIDYSYVVALGETLQNLVQQTVQQVDGLPTAEDCAHLEALYHQLQLENMQADDIRKMIQFAFLKASKADNLQANHQMTPDAISLLVAYMIDRLTAHESALSVGDLAVGSGNLLSTIVLFLQQSNKQVEGIGVDNDEVLVHVASQAVALERLSVQLLLQDGLSNLSLKPVDVMVSDLPIGYYPIDEVARTFETSNQEEHSYAHHLLIEQHIRYLKEAGIAIFIVPYNLFETEEAPRLLQYLQEHTFVQAMLALPNNLFRVAAHQKSVLIVQKKGNTAQQVSQVLLGDIPEFKQHERFNKFMTTFEKWAKEFKKG